MKPTNHPSVEGCTWCGRPATFRVVFKLAESLGLGRRGRAFTCDLHIADVRRRLCIIRVTAIEVPS